MDKVTWWHFQSTLKEVIWSKKFLNCMHGLKSAIIAIFQKGLGLPCPVSATLKNVLCADEYLERLAKLESAYSFMLKYSKITVCTFSQFFWFLIDMLYDLNPSSLITYYLCM